MPNPLHQCTSEDLDASWPALAELSDRSLVACAMEVLAEPVREPADSFVLHAPLELLTRAELLPAVRPDSRDRARQRIAQIAAEWNDHHPHIGASSVSAPLAGDLGAAVATGDLDLADRTLVDLCHRAPLDQFVSAAADQLLDHLGGAGHLPIYLEHLTRLHPAPRSALLMSRTLIRDLTRHHEWTMRWIDEDHRHPNGPTHDFTDVLADPPPAGEPESSFIYPTMHLVDTSGLAAELLAAPAATTPVDLARQQLLRIAARSMLQDDPVHAPYGWSHCLTLPAAALSVADRTADPQRAVAIAATFVLGIRATQSVRPLELDWTPSRPRSPVGLLDGDADHAVSVAWHGDDPDAVNTELATFAGTHRDAHLAKYTLACFHAADADPGAAPLYRAAAARLAAWWRDHDAPSALDEQGAGSRASNHPLREG